MIGGSESKGFNAFVLHVGRAHANQLASTVSRSSSSLWAWLKNQFKHDLVHTVAGFKRSYGQSLNNSLRSQAKQAYVIVHDAQKLSYQDITDLSELTQKSHGKLVLLHNKRSTEGFSAGSPLKALKDAGFNTLDAKSKSHPIEAEIIPCFDMRSQLVKHYAGLSANERSGVTVLALSKKEQETINQQIREILVTLGSVSVQSKTIDVLSTSILTDPQKKHGKFYHQGDRVTFSPFTKAQRHYRVVHCKNKQLAVKNDQGILSTIDLMGKLDFTVTKKKSIEIGVGERLTNDQALYINRSRVEKGSEFEVTKVVESGIWLHDGKKSLFLDNDTLSSSALSYDYSRRVSTLGATKKAILLASEPYKLNQQIFGEISENAKSIIIFTNDKIKAQKRLDENQICWTVKDIATRKPELVYRQIEFAEKAIEKDIRFLAEDLSRHIDTLDENEVARRALSYAVAVCSESEAAFSHADLMSNALKCGVGKIDHSDIEPLLAERIQRADLKHLGTYWVSKESLAIEKEIINTNSAHQNTLTPIEKDKNKLLSLPMHLTQGQKDAVALAVTNSDRFISVQGLAGVGKTTMLNLVQQISHDNGYNIVGLGPTHRSVIELRANGIEARTIDDFLLNQHGINDKSILIVDEVSMVGNSQYAKIQQKTIESSARSILVGDMTQLQSLSSGIAHELTVQSQSQKTAYMGENIRQKSSPLLKKASEHASRRQIRSSFKYLDRIKPGDYINREDPSFQPDNRSLVEVDCTGENSKKPDFTPIYTAVSNDYLSRTKEHQDKTIVIVHAHKDRKVIDFMIRQGLQRQGRIERGNKSAGRLFSRSIKLADLMDANSFKTGDVLRFDKSYSVARRGDYFTVTQVIPEKNQLKCTSQEGHEFSIHPNKIAEKARMSVYSYEEFDLSVNDTIRLKRSDKARGHIANEEYKVSDISEKSVATLIDKKGNKLPLDLNNKRDQHWDYAYTHTAFAIQGGTEDFVIALELNARVGATNHRSVGIDITRAKRQITIYTENLEGLVSRLDDQKLQMRSDKKSALIEYKKFASYNNKVALMQEKNTLQEQSAKASYPAAQDIRYTPNKAIRADEILPVLNSQMKELSLHLLGEPNRQMSTGTELRYGAKGSLSIDLNKGLWFNFESAEGGNALHLIGSEMGLNFKESLEFAKDFTHFTPNLKPIRNAKLPPMKGENQDEGMREYAKKLFNRATDIRGTLSERYLIEHRKVTNLKDVELKHLDYLKTYHDKREAYTPALVVVGRDNKGELKYIQAIRLDPVTGNKDLKSDLSKQIYGKLEGNGIRLNKPGKDNVTYLTEGVETGLSVALSKKDSDVIAVLSKGNFSNILLDSVKDNVVFCLDNDGKDTCHSSIVKAIDRLEGAGKKVQLVVPEKKGTDFNDVLIHESRAELDKQLSKLISPNDYRSKVQEVARNASSINRSLIEKIVDNNSQHRAIDKAIGDKKLASKVKLTQDNKRLTIAKIPVETKVKPPIENRRTQGIDREI